MYKITGADGKEYGPISADQLRQWIAEGRVNAQTRILAEGATEWRPLVEFPEFAASIPTPPPPGMAAAMPMPNVAAQNMVNGPATGLIVVACLYFAATVISLLFRLVGASFLASRQGPNDPFADAFSGVAGIISIVLGLILGGIILLGGIKMKKLENYALAMTGSIVAMLPCSVCCLVGLPIGIWAVVILSKPEVKGAFH